MFRLRHLPGPWKLCSRPAFPLTGASKQTVFCKTRYQNKATEYILLSLSSCFKSMSKVWWYAIPMDIFLFIVYDKWHVEEKSESGVQAAPDAWTLKDVFFSYLPLNQLINQNHSVLLHDEIVRGHERQNSSKTLFKRVQQILLLTESQLKWQSNLCFQPIPIKTQPKFKWAEQAVVIGVSGLGTPSAFCYVVHHSKNHYTTPINCFCRNCAQFQGPESPLCCTRGTCG